MHAFDFQSRTRFVFGDGALAQLGELTRGLGAQRVLVVTDPGIVQAGHVELGLMVLRAAGLDVAVFDGVIENPTTATVDEALSLANDFLPDLLVGLGGGSSMDCAKGSQLPVFQRGANAGLLGGRETRHRGDASHDCGPHHRWYRQRVTILRSDLGR